MTQNKVLAMIGLATKAGKTVSGEFMTEREVRASRAKLVIVAADASDNTKKKFTDSCSHYHIPLRIMADKVTLGHAMGKDFRASMAVVDAGFADSILKAMEN